MPIPCQLGKFTGIALLSAVLKDRSLFLLRPPLSPSLPRQVRREQAANLTTESSQRRKGTYPERNEDLLLPHGHPNGLPILDTCQQRQTARGRHPRYNVQVTATPAAPPCLDGARRTRSVTDRSTPLTGWHGNHHCLLLLSLPRASTDHARRRYDGTATAASPARGPHDKRAGVYGLLVKRTQMFSTETVLFTPTKRPSPFNGSWQDSDTLQRGVSGHLPWNPARTLPGKLGQIRMPSHPDCHGKSPLPHVSRGQGEGRTTLPSSRISHASRNKAPLNAASAGTTNICLLRSPRTIPSHELLLRPGGHHGH